MKTRTMISLATLSLLSLIGTHSVLAASKDMLTKVVSYTDLDLSSSAGEKALYRRLLDAAVLVCPDANHFATVFLHDQGARDQCVANVISSAVDKINVPAFTYYVNERHQRMSNVQVASR
jgi:UrcA family protein